MSLRTWILPLALVLVVAPAAAETIYRWVAPDGSVSFSSTPPPDREAEAMQFDEPAPLTPEELEARRERVRLMQELAAQMEEERRAREAAAVARRLSPPPTLEPALPPPAEPAEEPVDEGALEFDDWWTGPARPEPPSPPVVSESSGGGDHPDFQPATTPTPSFH